jgi:hypothetical protein
LELAYSFRPPSSLKTTEADYTYTFGQTCPIARGPCLDEFLGSIREGDTISIYLDETNPQLPRRDSPNFSPKGSILAQVIIYPIFTVCFALVGWRMFVLYE